MNSRVSGDVKAVDVRGNTNPIRFSYSSVRLPYVNDRVQHPHSIQYFYLCLESCEDKSLLRHNILSSRHFMYHQLTILSVLVQFISSEFTPHFRKFLHESYGVGIAGTLERTDLGLDASLGGMQNNNDVPKKQAVILVHGVTNKITRFMGSS
ncbi:hypothetical protein DICVIV_12245 [Dictyocaulus viviparus]|uniref:Uncharacterized protein n=1 Tax=Dictyocaulus viviparus TaxID=29172 RepID=A0A0D8XDE0_DICVI|nr:hypothetical protein DICVIV_12245 [Dictyocaulus viviparus]